MRLLNRTFFFFFLILHLGFFLSSFAQKDKPQLEQEKKLIQAQIKETQQILEQTSTKKKVSIGQLNAIKKQIDAHSQLISTFSSEVKVLDSKIGEDSEVVSALNKDLENLKKEYGAMVYSMHKSSGGFDRLAFIFASSNLSQFYMRFKYLEQYASARKNQVKLITDIKSEIESEKISLEKTKSEKSQILAEQIKEKEKLDDLKVQQNKVLASLKTEESKLNKDIAKKKDDISKLENLIAKLLEAEIRKTSGEAFADSKAKVDLNNVSSLFEKNKAILPWPVSTGFISGKFGTHPHPVLKRVKVPNDGVNIQTKQNEQVLAVFDGVVKKIAIVPGEFKYVVIVQHGSYFTVYAKLKKVNVKMGQQIARQYVIGEVNTDVDGISEVQFQVWKNTQKLDPELWLAKR
jgi:murein DD-endopeptidase MepM/ murein hydrolase activator NlpD